MIINCPTPDLIPSMKALWSEAFGESDADVNHFFNTAFSPERSRVAYENGEVLAALYVLDFSYKGKKSAYIYAVATAEKYRGRGICRTLIEDTHEYLRERGYEFAVLKPGDESLFEFYRKLGYKDCCSVTEVTVEVAENGIRIEKTDAESYCRLRRKYLPDNGAVFEGVSIDYLASFMELYAFDGGVMTAWRGNGLLFSAEILTDGLTECTEELLGGIVKALGCEKGIFRTVGDSVPFAMGYSLNGSLPERLHLGLAFD